MALRFRNMLAIPDEGFYRANHDANLREYYHRVGPPTIELTPNQIFIAQWYAQRAAQYREAYDHLKLIQAGLLSE